MIVKRQFRLPVKIYMTGMVVFSAFRAWYMFEFEPLPAVHIANNFDNWMPTKLWAIPFAIVTILGVIGFVLQSLDKQARIATIANAIFTITIAIYMVGYFTVWVSTGNQASLLGWTTWGIITIFAVAMLAGKLTEMKPKEETDIDELLVTLAEFVEANKLAEQVREVDELIKQI